MFNIELVNRWRNYQATIEQKISPKDNMNNSDRKERHRGYRGGTHVQSFATHQYGPRYSVRIWLRPSAPDSAFFQPPRSMPATSMPTRWIFIGRPLVFGAFIQRRIDRRSFRNFIWLDLGRLLRSVPDQLRGSMPRRREYEHLARWRRTDSCALADQAGRSWKVCQKQ